MPPKKKAKAKPKTSKADVVSDDQSLAAKPKQSAKNKQASKPNKFEPSTDLALCSVTVPGVATADSKTKNLEAGICLDAGGYTAAERKRAARAMKRKLNFVDPDELDEARDAMGNCLLDIVCKEFKEREDEGKYITPEWWKNAIARFILSPLSFDALPEPIVLEEDDSLYDDQMAELLWLVVGDNPTARWKGVELVTKRIETSGRLPCYQLKCLLETTQENAEVTRKMSMTLHLAIFSHMVEHRVLLLWPQVWPVIKTRMGQVMIWLWSTVAGTMSKNVFVEKYRDECLLFIDETAMKEVLDAESQNLPVPIQALNKVLSSQLGSKVFVKLAHQSQWNQFINVAAERIKIAMEHNFMQEEVTSFFKSMRQATNELVIAGHEGVAKKKLEARWLLWNITLPVQYIDDWWRSPYYVTLSMCLLNSGQVMWMPYEKLLLGDGKVDGFPETCQVPDSVMKPVKLCRQTLAPLLEAEVTVSRWKAVIAEHRENLLKLNKDFGTDEIFVKTYLADALVKVFHDKICKAFPESPTVVRTGEEAAAAKQQLYAAQENILRLRGAPLTRAVEEKGEQDIVWAANFLQSVLEYQAPIKAMSEMPDWKQNVILKVESCLVTMVLAPASAKGSSVQAQLQACKMAPIQGKDAMSALVKDLLEHADDKTRSSATVLSQVEVVRMFGWLVAEDQKASIDKVVKQNSQDRVKQMGEGKILKAITLAEGEVDPSPKKVADVVDKQVALMTSVKSLQKPGEGVNSSSSKDGMFSSSNPSKIDRKAALFKMLAKKPPTPS